MTIFILLLALLLRFIFLNQSLWLDESIQALALMGHLGPILQYAIADFQPPLYHFLLLGWTQIAGFSELALRTPSLIAGVMTVYIGSKLATLIGGKKTGIIAGLLLATNPLLIYYSQEGRTYAMTTFFVTASFYYLFSSLQNKTRSNYLLYCLFIGLSLWSSYLAWFALLLQGSYLLYKKRYDLALLMTASAITLLAWLPAFLAQLHLGLSDAANMPTWGKVVGGASAKALALTWVKTLFGRISFDNKWLYGGLTIFVATLHLSVLRKSHARHFPLLLLWLASALVALIFALFIPIYSYTRVLFIVPAYLILLAIGLSKTSKYLARVAIVIQLISLAIFWVSPRFHREDWRTLTHDLNVQDKVTVALPSLRVGAPFLYYGLRQTPRELVTDDLSNAEATIYYVRYGEDIFDPGHASQARLMSAGYTISSQKTYSGIQVDIYENRR